MKLNIQMFGGRGASSNNNSESSFVKGLVRDYDKLTRGDLQGIIEARYPNPRESDRILRQVDELAGKTNSEIKTKGDRNIIPRDFKQAYGRFNIKTNANESTNDRFSVYKNEFGEIEMKNMETGRIFAGNMSALRDKNIFVFEKKKRGK